MSVCGGPSIPVLVGRPDATAADPTGRMVSEKAGVEALKANFADKGLGVKQMVVLSGAHTLGGWDSALHCGLVGFGLLTFLPLSLPAVAEPYLVSTW